LPTWEIQINKVYRSVSRVITSLASDGEPVLFRQMKDLIALVGLLLFLVLALVAYQVLDANRQERLVIGWSNSLVWSALGTPTTPRFEATALSSGDAPKHWIVAGQVAYRDDAGALLQRTYEAAVEQVCAHDERRECWHLGALSLDGLAVDPSTPLAAEDAPEAAPAEAEPEETAPLAKGKAESQPTAVAERAVAPAVETKSPPPMVMPTDPADLLRAIQEALNTAGHDAGPLDGQMGPRTRAAIKSYQQANGLAADGVPRPALLRHLQAARR
jgi:Putative peptidoglycan binding domain